MAQPRGCSIEVSTAVVAIPMPFAASTSERANSSACSRSRMKAARPNLTSSTSADSPSAAFLDTIEEVIRGIDATVSVMSRMAYMRRSAGTRASLWPTMATPMPSTCSWMPSMLISTLNPGILSSLSKVPPVWPSPLPEIIGTFRPHAAKAGASTSDTLSPTPPVECLSTTRPEISEPHSITSPESLIASVSATVSCAESPSSKTSRSHSVNSSSDSEPSTTP